MRSIAQRVTLVSRPGCHLCDEARSVIERVSLETGTGWHELSVDDDPVLLARFSELVPVVLVDGEQHDFLRVDAQRLRRRLQGRRWFR